MLIFDAIISYNVYMTTHVLDSGYDLGFKSQGPKYLNVCMVCNANSSYNLLMHAVYICTMIACGIIGKRIFG